MCSHSFILFCSHVSDQEESRFPDVGCFPRSMAGRRQRKPKLKKLPDRQNKSANLIKIS